LAPALWPFGIYLAAVAITVVAMLAVSYVVGQHHDEPQTGTPYEAGIVPDSPIEVRVASEFYLLAAFFVVFDVESIFLFAWTVAGRSFGWAGFVELAVFVGLLLVALLYLWRAGALDGNRGVGQRLAAGMADPHGGVAHG
jgi:NADH-quinone oxidoreductase subunit A